MQVFHIVCISISLISAGSVQGGPLPGQQEESTTGIQAKKHELGQESLKQADLGTNLESKPSVTSPNVVILNLDGKEAAPAAAVGTGSHVRIRPGYVMVIGSRSQTDGQKQEGTMYGPPTTNPYPTSENDPAVPVVIIVGPQIQFGVPNGVINGPQIQIADEVAVINGAQTQVGGQNPVINGAQTQVDGEGTVINGPQNGSGGEKEGVLTDPMNDLTNAPLNIIKGNENNFKAVRVVIVKA